MAYMDQTKKTAIAAALKPVVPAGWKYTLRVRNHLSIDMTIQSAPVDLLAYFKSTGNYFQVATGDAERMLRHNGDDRVALAFSEIHDALNLGNHDNSDLMTDYFDVGHYVTLSIGRWDKPFVCTAVEVAA